MELAFRTISILLVSKIIFIRLNEFFLFIFAKGDNGPFRENLLVMDIDVALNLGDDPLTVSNRFNQHNITLTVVSVEAFNDDVSNYYRTLARYTGTSQFFYLYHLFF